MVNLFHVQNNLGVLTLQFTQWSINAPFGVLPRFTWLLVFVGGVQFLYIAPPLPNLLLYTVSFTRLGEVLMAYM